MKKITTQEELDELLSIPSWSDAFVKELYFVSPSTINELNEQHILKILITTSENSCPCLELYFVCPENVCCNMNCDLEPRGTIYPECILLSLNEYDYSPIKAKELYYRILSTDSWGYQNHYSNEVIFDEGGYFLEYPPVDFYDEAGNDMQWKGMTQINSQNALNKLLEEPFWHNAQVKKLITVSPSYVDVGGIAAYNSLPALKMLIGTTEYSSPWLELFFVDTQSLGCHFEHKFVHLHGEFRRYKVNLSLNEGYMESRQLYYKIHSNTKENILHTTAWIAENT